MWYADDIGVPPLESMTDGIAPNTEDNEQRTFAWAATTAAARIVERCVESDMARESQQNSSQHIDRSHQGIEVDVPTMPASTEYKAQDANSFECVVCMDEEKTHVILPCGHYCVCAKCLATLTQCPVCRKEIQQTVRCYNS